MTDKYYKLYEELTEISKEILYYYDIDKIKPYAVYIWTKPCNDDDDGENVFDINPDKIVFYNKEHKIIEEALPVINSIQCRLKEIEIYLKGK